VFSRQLITSQRTSETIHSAWFTAAGNPPAADCFDD
jgi:hypothetical protein